jgi:hypothetical protein
MKIDIVSPPDPQIFRERKKYALWFAFSLLITFAAIGVFLFAIYGDTHGYSNLDDWWLGLLVVSSIGVTWSGNKLQRYKRLYRPHFEKLKKLKKEHPTIEKYCNEVEGSGRRLIRAEYEAFVDYAEKHSSIPFI